MKNVKVTHNDFTKIAKEHDYFLWHFLQKNQNDGNFVIRSINENENMKYQLNLLLNEIEIPYFESYTEDSIDFLHELGIPYKSLWNPNFKFYNSHSRDAHYHPVIVGFKKFEKIKTTFDVCYCLEGVVKIIGELNPELILNHKC